MFGTLTRRQPFFEGLPDVHAELGNLLDKMESNLGNIFKKEPLFENLAKFSYPKTNIRMNKSDLIFELAIPYYNSDDIEIKMQDEILSVISKAAPVVEGEYVIREVSQKAFQRSWKMMREVNPKNIMAKYDRGVLYITVKDYFADEQKRYEGHRIEIEK